MNSSNARSESGGVEGAALNVWQYFVKEDDRVTAKCLICGKILKLSHRSTKGLRVHLNSRHKSVWEWSPELDVGVSSHLQSQGSTSLIDSFSPSHIPVYPSKKPRMMDNHLTDNTVEVLVSRMVSIDSIPLSAFLQSSDLRKLFTNSGYKLPNLTSSILTMVNDCSNIVQSATISQIRAIKNNNGKCSLTISEWKATPNRMFINLTLISRQTLPVNLGLIRVKGVFQVENSAGAVTSMLELYDVGFNDIVAIVTDGTAAMRETGSMVPCNHQTCFAFGIQQAVMDTFYEVDHDIPFSGGGSRKVGVKEKASDDSDIEEFNVDDSFKVVVSSRSEKAKLGPEFEALVRKVRKVVKLLKKPSFQSGSSFQNYVGAEHSKKLELVMDCGFRWDSLLAMLERFVLWKSCIGEGLMDLNSNISFTELEWSKISDMVACLEPLKLAVDVLCREDSTLVTAETTLRFIVDKLMKKNSNGSKLMAAALKHRVAEHRTNLTPVLLYLHNLKKYEQDVINIGFEDSVFSLLKKDDIKREIKMLVERLLKFPPLSQVNEPAVEVLDGSQLNISSGSQRHHGSLKGELEFAIKSESSPIPTNKEGIGWNMGMLGRHHWLSPCSPAGGLPSLGEELETIISKDYSPVPPPSEGFAPLDLDSTLKKELAAYDCFGVRGVMLARTLEYLETVPPTCEGASERAFYASNCAHLSVSSALCDEALNSCCMLRSHFLNLE